MAKGQKRSNRETKKPKKAKAPVPTQVAELKGISASNGPAKKK